jgi:sugar-specific transcriptional regulator TrmB
MNDDLLLKTGLSVRELSVYKLLLAEGELMASLAAKKAGLIRTNAYDVLNALVKKGIVAYVVRNGKRYFRAAEPEKLLDYLDAQRRDLDETKDTIAKMLPQLRPVRAASPRPVIEIYEGKEGMKTLLSMSVRESLRTGKEILGISVQQQRCRELAGPYHVRWYRDRERHKIKSRYLMSVQERIIPVKHTRFKVLPKAAKNPNEVFIFGDVTAQFFFTGGIFTAVVIKNKEITDKHRAYFDFLWSIVKRDRKLMPRAA